jgi:hypothetical protein
LIRKKQAALCSVYADSKDKGRIWKKGFAEVEKVERRR